MQRFEELNTPYGTEIKNNDVQNGTKIIFRAVTNFKNKSSIYDQKFQLILIHGTTDYSAAQKRYLFYFSVLQH